MRKSRKAIVVAAAITLLTISVTKPTAAKPTVTKPTLAGLTSNQRATLKSLGIKVAIPKYIPKGFRVAQVKTEPCASATACRIGRPSYTITYQSSQKACFSIEGTSGGLGGPGMENTIPIKTKLFGPSKLGFNYIGDGDESLSSEWLTQSFDSGPYYRLNSQKREDLGCTDTISLEPAVDIVESLEWLP